MGSEDQDSTSTVVVRDALRRLVAEPEFDKLRAQYGLEEIEIHIPDEQHGQSIIPSVLGLIDSADLVVFNLSPKSPAKPDRANTFYELGIVHAQGIPSMLTMLEGSPEPYYIRGCRQYRFKESTVDSIADSLRAPLMEFLDFDNRVADFSLNELTRYYGVPLVDNAAAGGVATGYFQNFLSRLVLPSGMRVQHPEIIKQVVCVFPSSLDSDYVKDLGDLKKNLEIAGLQLETTKLTSALDGSPIWFENIGPIIVDLPRSSYLLAHSPRLLALSAKGYLTESPKAAENQARQLAKMETGILDKFEKSIRYQMRSSGVRPTDNILHFTTIDEAAGLVRKLQEE